MTTTMLADIETFDDIVSTLFPPPPEPPDEEGDHLPERPESSWLWAATPLLIAAGVCAVLTASRLLAGH